MSAHSCPTCGGAVVSVDDVLRGLARYADTAGGHADRHTLVVEAAEKAVSA